MWFQHFKHLLIVAVLLLLLDFKTTLANELEIIVEYNPDDCSEKADIDDEVAIHYTGRLDSGTVFDSSVQQKREPIKFVLGKGMVIPGWEQGIQGMCVGEKRKLIIPSHLAYGEKGHPPVIPAHATLTFETELVSIKKAAFQINILGIVQTLSIPALVAYVIYYIYTSYKKEVADTGSKKSTKQEKRDAHKPKDNKKKRK